MPYDPIHGQGFGGPKVLQTINYREKNPYPVYIIACIGNQIFMVVGLYRVRNKVRLSVMILWISCCSLLLLVLLIQCHICVYRRIWTFSCY